jgi:poly(3-hydroxybutyrate) depolymerase
MPGTGMRSRGCGQTSTVTFATVAGEDANARPGTPNLGTGKGGYVSITSGGQRRGFAMRLPDNYDSNHPYSLFFAFHWNGGNAKAVDTGGDNGYFTAYYGLQRKSNNGAIFVGPDGQGGGWPNSNDSDLHFTDDMVKLISDNYCVDMSNIITMGFSYGGGMSYKLACARGNATTNTVGYAFRAAAIFEGCAFLGGACEGGNDPVAIWQKVGMTDSTCDIASGTPIRDTFLKANKCTGWTSETGNVAASQSGTITQEPPRPPMPGRYINPGGHICTNYTGCSAAPYRWCVDQAGHGNATTDGTASLFDECANVSNQNPMGNCSPGCPCTWTPDDIWTWLNNPTTNKYTPNYTGN